jgi:hypothetical protein
MCTHDEDFSLLNIYSVDYCAFCRATIGSVLLQVEDKSQPRAGMGHSHTDKLRALISRAEFLALLYNTFMGRNDNGRNLSRYGTCNISTCCEGKLISTPDHLRGYAISCGASSSIEDMQGDE